MLIYSEKVHQIKKQGIKHRISKHTKQFYANILKRMNQINKHRWKHRISKYIKRFYIVRRVNQIKKHRIKHRINKHTKRFYANILIRMNQIKRHRIKHKWVKNTKITHNSFKPSDGFNTCVIVERYVSVLTEARKTIVFIVANWTEQTTNKIKIKIKWIAKQEKKFCSCLLKHT